MKKLSFKLSILCLLIMVNCQKKSTNEPPANNIHPQVDIPWPSLADSPWPIALGNTQCTGRSSNTGPREGKVDWIFTEEGMRIETGSPVIGENGTIYFMDDHCLYAINAEGELKWKFDPERQLNGTPIIGEGDIIYFGAGSKAGSQGAIYAINNEGTLKWERAIEGPIYCRGGAIGFDGTIYFTARDGFLYAVDPEGLIKWKYFGDQGFHQTSHSCISFSPDGNILYAASRDSKIVAIDTNIPKINWKYDIGYLLTSSITVDNEGNLYFFMKTEDHLQIVSLNNNGLFRWQKYEEEFMYLNDKTNIYLDKNGNSYFSNWGRKLISLDYNGNVRWLVKMNALPRSPIIGDDNEIIFIASESDVLVAYDQHGNIFFSCTILPWAEFPINGAISDDGKLYLCSRQKLICIK